jgi:hypothetical protein
MVSPLGKVKNKKMPQKHQSTKTHKAVIINTVHFSEIFVF